MESEHVTGKEMEYDRKDAHGCMMLHVFYCRGSLKNRVCRSRLKFEVRKIYVSHPGANEGKKTFPPKLILCSEYLTGTGISILYYTFKGLVPRGAKNRGSRPILVVIPSAQRRFCGIVFLALICLYARDL
jgi:hypothetical protein